MKISHIIKKNKIEKEGQASVCLTNKTGGFCYFDNSRFGGLFFYFKELFKTLQDFKHDEKIIGIENHFSHIIRHRESFFEKITFYDNVLEYTTNKDKNITLQFDCKKNYDNIEFGKFYNISKENNLIIIKFIQENEYEFFIAIDCNNPEFIQKWTEVSFDYDQKRNSPPFTWYIYDAIKCSSKKIRISAGLTKDDAIKHLKSKEKKSEMKLISKIDLPTSFAYACAKNSLDSLNCTIGNTKGIYAGLPWFFQFWTRDEAISTDNKKILLQQIKTILPNGRVPNIRKHNYPGSPLGSADGVGWSFFRLSQCKLTKEETEFVKSKLIYSLNKLNFESDFVINGPLETWMDTGNDDVRSGARIEIQALTLAMLSFAYKLTKDEKYKEQEEKMTEHVRNNFWKGKVLADGLGDFTIRPNIFIAYYVYPNLLTQNEWKTCFKNALDSLWLNWGGLSTIDKENNLYQSIHTGENNKSYHRGDSWYWINNLAAICMYKVDKNFFEEYISKIKEASTNEILWYGMLGHHAEISDSSKQRSKGCKCQAWSAKMYIELIDELDLN